LPTGDLSSVVTEWARRVRNAEGRVLAGSLYVGHGWRHARAAAQISGADLAVISAGLGVVRAETPVPSYGMTIVDAADDVRRRIEGSITPTDWWRALSAERLAGPTLGELLDGESGLVLVAMPETYLAMVGEELAASRPVREGRLRIFTGVRIDAVRSDLTKAVMPYDGRLDDPALGLGGTSDSFAARALRHFVEVFGISASDLATDKQLVLTTLEARTAPERAVRARRTDAEITSLLREHWHKGRGAPSRLLRILRDDLGVACEQSRITRLVDDLRAEGAVDVV